MKDYAVEYRGQPVFQCSSASRKFLNLGRRVRRRRSRFGFQCSSASRKFLNRLLGVARCSAWRVSVLFSEPKIPQSERGERRRIRHAMFQCSSASRKFLNLSGADPVRGAYPRFQCSSASRKFLNAAPCPAGPVRQTVSVLFSEPKIPQWTVRPACRYGRVSFSALQRAENSSMDTRTTPQPSNTYVSVLFSEPKIPQSTSTTAVRFSHRSFSALQRAENSSMRWPGTVMPPARRVSVLFSEPKIPQSRSNDAKAVGVSVSVLFSEPKIPQFCRLRSDREEDDRFSALQRAENSSIDSVALARRAIATFQCSSASRKFLNEGRQEGLYGQRFVFQCSSASRKFLNGSPGAPGAPGA